MVDQEIVISNSRNPVGSPSGPSRQAHKPILERLFPPWTWSVNGPLLAVAIIASVAVGIIAAVVVTHPYLQLDATVERDIQATNLGPLTLTFPFFTWLGGPGGIYMQVVVILLVLLLNRRAWILALAAFPGGLWYEVIVHLEVATRPVTRAG